MTYSSFLKEIFIKKKEKEKSKLLNWNFPVRFEDTEKEIRVFQNGKLMFSFSSKKYEKWKLK